MDLWPVAAVILGFQLVAFSWRIAREIEMWKEGEPIWFPLADWLMLVSWATLVIGVFIIPVVIEFERWAKLAFGTSLVFMVGYPFALLGHYSLFRKTGRPRIVPYAPIEERAIVVAFLAAGVIYCILSAVLSS